MLLLQRRGHQLLAAGGGAVAAGGRGDDCPVAIVEDGYGPGERVTIGTLSTIAHLAAAKQVPGVATLDLYGSYPDYHIHVPAEQARLAAARLLVLLHPIHWYSMPPLQKLWLDEVFTWGWAYGAGGTALQGKGFWLAATTGGPEASYHPEHYNRYPFDAFLPPYEQTAMLCGMRFLPPLVLHGAHSASEAAVAEHIDRFTRQLRLYADTPLAGSAEECPDAALVPAADRKA